MKIIWFDTPTREVVLGGSAQGGLVIGERTIMPDPPTTIKAMPAFWNPTWSDKTIREHESPTPT